MVNSGYRLACWLAHIVDDDDTACRAKYDASLKLNWRRGKRFRMWFEHPDNPGTGEYWSGTVLGRVQRDRFDPRRSSPWEALRVKWDM